MKKSCAFWFISSKDKFVDWELDGRCPESFSFGGNLVWNFKKRKPQFNFRLLWLKKLLLQGTTCYVWSFLNSPDNQNLEKKFDGRNADSSSVRKNAPFSSKKIIALVHQFGPNASDEWNVYRNFFWMMLYKFKIVIKISMWEIHPYVL